MGAWGARSNGRAGGTEVEVAFGSASPTIVFDLSSFAGLSVRSDVVGVGRGGEARSSGSNSGSTTAGVAERVAAGVAAAELTFCKVLVTISVKSLVLGNVCVPVMSKGP